MHAGAGIPQNVAMFIDGKIWNLCRPVRHQQILYSGYKHIHCVKFQSVVLASGLFINMYGPMAPQGDSFVLGASGVIDFLHQLFRLHNITPFAMYGDSAYALSEVLLKEYPYPCEFNSIMSSVRETVEWGFKEIVSHFAWLDYNKNMKLLLQPVGKYWVVASLLVNCWTYLYGNQISVFFDSPPCPDLETYLGWAADCNQ